MRTMALFHRPAAFHSIRLFALFLLLPSLAATAWIQVTGPVAVADAATTDEDVPVNVRVLDNDLALDVRPFQLSVIGGASNGTAAVQGNSMVRYTPNADFFGTDAFQYEVCDGSSICASAGVTVTVNPVDDLPVVTADSAEVQENSSVTTDVLANDLGLGDGLLSVAIAANPSHGSASVNADHTITYTPLLAYNGLDSYSYQVCDLDNDCATGPVDVSVNLLDNIPVATADQYTTTEDTPVINDVLANDSDLLDIPLTISVPMPPSYGSVAVMINNTLTYTPISDFNGTDGYNYRVCDADSDCAEARVEITVTPVDDVPQASPDTVTLDENSQAVTNVLANDAGLGDPPFVVTVSTPPASGGTTVHADNSITYSPYSGFNGTDSYAYQVCDTDGDCSAALVSITVAPVDSIPAANPDSDNTDEDTPVISNVLANDTGVHDVPLAVTIQAAPAHGTAAVVTSNNIRYSPAANYYGSDSYTYQVCDVDGDCSQAVMSITVMPVDDTPVALADTGNTSEDVALDVNVLSNDSGLGDGPFAVTILIAPVHGTAAVGTGNMVRYTPAGNYNGTDSFRYRVCDADNDCSAAVTSLTISPQNDPPDALDDQVSTVEDTVLAITVLSNDQDIDGDVFILETFEAASIGGGTVTRRDNGTPADLSDDLLLYSPALDFTGSDQFSYTISDGSLKDTAAVMITVEAAHEAPIANNDSYATIEDTTLVISATHGVLANDVDSDSTGLTAVLVVGPSHGTLTLNLDGSFTYTPQSGYVGSDSFTYRANDGALDSNLATVAIQISIASITLSAVADAYNIEQDTALMVAEPGVMANDTMAAGTTPQVALSSGPTEGILVLESNGSFTYTPGAGFVGVDSFSYHLVQGSLRSGDAQVEITVVDTNAPVVEWTSPALDGERFDVSSQMVSLQVNATDNVGVASVRFYRWDAPTQSFIDIYTDIQAPYAFEFDTQVLNPQWNQVFARAYDAAGNESERQYIWLYSTQTTYLVTLPFAVR